MYRALTAGLLLPFALLAEADYFPPPDAQGGWRSLTNPSEILTKAGMDPDQA